jgi:hypothetical protein
MGARYYDANTRTFLSADPLDYNAGINLYSYAAGDPVNFTDPDGRIAKGVGSGWSGGLSSSSPTSASFNMGMSLGGTVSGAVSGLWSGGSDLVMGEYSTAPATWGRTLGQLGVGLTPVGIAADIRDWSKSAADLRNGSGSWAQMAVSTVFLFPGASELGKVGKLGNGLIGITPQGGRAIGAARGIPDPYTGIRQASQYLQEMGVSRADRVRYLQSFEPQNMVVRQAGQSEFGLRFFSDPARAGGQYLFETFPASRASLAIKPEWSTMAGFRQFQIRPGATLLEGRAAAQGPFLQGGQTQKFILDSRADLIAP